MALTSEQKRKTEEALEETQRLLAKELRYPADLQKQDYLKFLRGHIEKLELMLKPAQFTHDELANGWTEYSNDNQ